MTIDSDMWIIFCPLWQQVIGAKKIHVKGNKTYNDVVWILDNQVYNNSPICMTVIRLDIPWCHGNFRK